MIWGLSQLLRLHLQQVSPSPNSLQQQLPPLFLKHIKHITPLPSLYCLKTFFSQLATQFILPLYCRSLFKCCPSVISSLNIYLKQHICVFFHSFTLLFLQSTYHYLILCNFFFAYFVLLNLIGSKREGNMFALFNTVLNKRTVPGTQQVLIKCLLSDLMKSDKGLERGSLDQGAGKPNRQASFQPISLGGLSQGIPTPGTH